MCYNITYLLAILTDLLTYVIAYSAYLLNEILKYLLTYLRAYYSTYWNTLNTVQLSWKRTYVGGMDEWKQKEHQHFVVETHWHTVTNYNENVHTFVGWMIEKQIRKPNQIEKQWFS